MSNPAGKKGYQFEASLLPVLSVHWPEVTRGGKQGAKDKGDFHMPGNNRYIIEAKNRAQLNLAGWVREAEIEAANKGVPCGVVIHKRRGTTDPYQQYVTMTLGTFLELCHGD